jgi:signal transduction histidine kinase/GAF domain-containing protein
MFNYLAFLHGGISQSTGDAFTDGSELSRQCLEQLKQIDNPEHFPPRLLILLASPTYLEESKAERLLAGVHRAFAEAGFDDIPLIGSSAAAVFFNRRTSEQGALLVCLASRMIRAVIGLSENARNAHEEAATRLLDNLELNFAETGTDPNPQVNRLLFTFFPGFCAPGSGDKYPAPELHRLLRDLVRARVPIVGGVSSANDRNRAGLQMAGSKVYTDALVAAKLSTGFPITSSIGHGLTSTGRFLRVKRLGADRRTIIEFREGLPADLLGLRHQKEVALLGEMSLDRDPIVTAARMSGDGQSVTMLREAHDNSLFEILEPEPNGMLAETAQLMTRALHRLRVKNPIGGFGIHCNARRSIELDIEQMSADAEALLKRENSYVGGFFDGEIGLDQTGRSLFGNWCAANIFFGDEMRERTPLHRGFNAMAEYAPTLTSGTSLNEAIEHSLDLVYRTGFPGAMISLALRDHEQEWVVARKAKGSRFEKIVEMTKRPFSDNDILTIAAREKQPFFIRDSRADERCNKLAVEKSGIVSQYIIPLLNLYRETFAVLQIDLGDAPDEEQFHKKVLNSLGAVIEAMLARIISREEINIARELDEALKKSLSAATLNEALQQYIEAAVSIFGAEMGHIRLANNKDKVLVLAAGTGAYYEAIKKVRRAIKYNDPSPTCLAFKSGKEVVVNDARNNKWHNNLCQRCQDNPAASEALNKVESYANVPIRNGPGNVVGTINLVVSSPWFFTHSRIRSLTALSQRVSFLLEHLKRKEAEMHAQRHRSFLIKVGPQFVRTANFRDPIKTLTEATARFREAANAEIASLFLWDEESQQFILRAQDGWVNPDWVDAARYQKSERWTGTVALADEPQYINDLHAYNRKNKIDLSRHYADQMFGARLSKEFTVEAIGLPLKVKEKHLGVLTLYRRVKPDQPKPDQDGKRSGFITTDKAVLQEAANNMAAMVSAQLHYLRAKWELAERDRHDEVCKAMEQSDSPRSLEERTCLQVAESFLAIEAKFYLAADPQHSSDLSCAAGVRRLPVISNLPVIPADNFVRRAAVERATQKKQHAISGSDWGDPEIARTEGLIERIAIPLIYNNQLIGVLDLRFGLKRTLSPLKRPQDLEYLERLGKKIAFTYIQQKELAQKKESEAIAERSRLAVQAMGAMVFQTAHRLMNLVQDLRSMPDLIAEAEDEEKREERIKELSALINSATERIKRPMEVARQMKNINLQLHDLRSALCQVLQDLPANSGINIHLMVPKGRMIWMDQELIREAFRNIIHNALKAMPKGGTLRIDSSLSPDRKTVRVVFIDNGSGMSKEEKEAALSGFVTTQSHTGLGVLVSLLLIRAQGGDLDIESEKGVGTKVSVTLPYYSMEESP